MAGREALHDQLVELARQRLGRMRGRRLRRRVAYLLRELRIGRMLEQRAPRQQVITNRADRVDIRPRIDHLAEQISLVADSGRLLALDLVEVNPVLDVQNATAILAAELAASAFGMGIL